MTPLQPVPRPSPQGRDRGFTLIEILVAIVLVGVLAAVAVVGVGALTDSGARSACTASADAARTASRLYYTSHGAHPTELTALTGGLTPLLVAPTEATVSAGAISTDDWTLTMTNGDSGPTFTCGDAATATTTAGTSAFGGLTTTIAPAGSTTTIPTTTSAVSTTTAVSTTAVPTTAVSTTSAVSTTAVSTTAVSTTAVSTTAVPTTAVSTTAAPTTTVAGLPEGVWAVGKVTGDARYFLEWDVVVTNKLPLTGMALTITATHDGTWRYHGQWADLWGGVWKGTWSASSRTITYRFDLLAGQRIVTGAWTLAGQAGGTGVAHDVTGDRWTLTVTTEYGTGTLSGTFG